MSPGGTWRNLDGSWSLRNFDYGSDDEPPSEPPRGYRMPPISELRRRAAGYMGREVVTREPPEHFNVENWIAATRDLRGNRTPSPDSSPPPSCQIAGGHMEAHGRPVASKKHLPGAGGQASKEAKTPPPLRWGQE